MSMKGRIKELEQQLAAHAGQTRRGLNAYVKKVNEDNKKLTDELNTRCKQLVDQTAVVVELKAELEKAREDYKQLGLMITQDAEKVLNEPEIAIEVQAVV